MSQVGKPFWKPNVKERIMQVFCDYLVSIRSREEAEEFIDVLLTSTEKVNLPKRLGIAILLADGSDWRDIKDELHISSATVARIAEKITSKSHKKIASFTRSILRENLPNRTYDPSPFRGKRVYRRKGEGIQKPYRDLPY